MVHGVVRGGGLRLGPLVRRLCLRPQLRRRSPPEEVVVVTVAAEAMVVVALYLRRPTFAVDRAALASASMPLAAPRAAVFLRMHIALLLQSGPAAAAALFRTRGGEK